MMYCDISFPIRGVTLPRDHGYMLYGALSRVIPEIHSARWIAVHGIGGRRLDPETLVLQRGSSLRLRIPIDKIKDVLPLVGQIIDLAGRQLLIGAPSVLPLQPAAALDARLVVIRLTDGVKTAGGGFSPSEFEARFTAEAARQLDELGVTGAVSIHGRAAITVAGRRIIGCAIRVRSLRPEHSMVLQIHGIGGKRVMGCGIFRPARGGAA